MTATDITKTCAAVVVFTCHGAGGRRGEKELAFPSGGYVVKELAARLAWCDAGLTDVDSNFKA